MNAGTNGNNGFASSTSSSDNETNGVNGEHKKEKKKMNKRDQELVRLIGQHLISMGLTKSANVLISETGTKLEHGSATDFRGAILGGDWDCALTALDELKPQIKKIAKIHSMTFAIYEQKFLELLEEGDCLAAFQCLRFDLAPLKVNEERLAKLAQIIMINDPKQIRSAAGWAGKGGQSRANLMERLQSYLPHHVMLPPRRLSTLLTQAQLYQRQQCLYTSYNVTQASLLYDVKSPKKRIPGVCCQTLNNHNDDVTICRFNHSGSKLATGSKDQTVIIWNVNSAGHVTLDKTLHIGAPCCYLTWSPDDQHILVTGNEECSDIWLFDVKAGIQKNRMSQSNEDSLIAAAWFPDGQKYVCGGKKGQFYQVDLDGNVLESWEGVRVYGLHCLSDGRSVLAADSHCRIRSYDFDSILDKEVLEADSAIMTFSVTMDDQYALLNVQNQGLHLWDIKCNSLVRRFRGNKQGFFLIHSCFGGENEELIASGSEDATIYVYHRERETPLIELEGHDKPVTCVHFHPTITGLLASASDDCTVKIWRPTESEGTENSDEDVEFEFDLPHSNGSLQN